MHLKENKYSQIFAFILLTKKKGWLSSLWQWNCWDKSSMPNKFQTCTVHSYMSLFGSWALLFFSKKKSQSDQLNGKETTDFLLSTGKNWSIKDGLSHPSLRQLSRLKPYLCFQFFLLIIGKVISMNIIVSNLKNFK